MRDDRPFRGWLPSSWDPYPNTPFWIIDSFRFPLYTTYDQGAGPLDHHGKPRLDRHADQPPNTAGEAWWKANWQAEQDRMYTHPREAAQRYNDRVDERRAEMDEYVNRKMRIDWDDDLETLGYWKVGSGPYYCNSHDYQLEGKCTSESQVIG